LYIIKKNKLIDKDIFINNIIPEWNKEAKAGEAKYK